ncbi:MAG: methyltransferase domain-containing protein [Bacteroidota bacterium]
MSSRFALRSNEAELMDDLNSDGPVIEQTLRELETINKWLGGNYVTINAIQKLIETSNNTSWRIVDIGCGGGDILKLIAKWARKRKLKVELIGVDANPHVIDFAERNSTGFSEITYKAVDIFSDEFNALKADIITATLFTHHFSDDQLINLFRAIREQVSTGIAINDLHRHWFAYHSINLLTGLFSKSPMVKNDAGVSVLRSFRKKEWLNILKEAGFSSYSLKWMWAFRWQTVIHLPD